MTSISAAALPLRQPSISQADRAHPRFAEYMNYRAAMSSQLVEASDFQSWLLCSERELRDEELERHPRFKEFQQWMRDTQGGTPGKTKLKWPATFHAWLEGECW